MNRQILNSQLHYLFTKNIARPYCREQNVNFINKIMTLHIWIYKPIEKLIALKSKNHYGNYCLCYLKRGFMIFYRLNKVD